MADSAETLRAAARQLLRPLVRILLRHGVSHGEFQELTKRVFFDVAGDEFALPGRKPSLSRLAVLTGLTRKEVRRLAEQTPDDGSTDRTRYNRAARVVSAWRRESDFLAADGNPLPLAFDGEPPSFSQLVRRFGSDVPPRAMLDELLRVGSVERDADGRLTLVQRAYIPSRGDEEKLGILGRDAAELIGVIDHNLTQPPEQAFFQRKVAYDNLPAEFLPELRADATARAQALLEHLDRSMSAHDRDDHPEVAGTGRRRVALGIYYLEEDLSGGS